MNAELFNGWAGWLTQHARPWLPLIGTAAALLALMLLWALVRRSWRMTAGKRLSATLPEDEVPEA